MTRLIAFVLCLTAVPALAHSETYLPAALLVQRTPAIFATAHAAVWPEGTMSIIGAPEQAADEAARAVSVDCPALVKSSQRANTIYTMLLVGKLTSLGVSWSIGLRPNGGVVYVSIEPVAAMREYFTELAKQLACETAP